MNSSPSFTLFLIKLLDVFLSPSRSFDLVRLMKPPTNEFERRPFWISGRLEASDVMAAVFIGFSCSEGKFDPGKNVTAKIAGTTRCRMTRDEYLLQVSRAKFTSRIGSPKLASAI